MAASIFAGEMKRTLQFKRSSSTFSRMGVIPALYSSTSRPGLLSRTENPDGFRESPEVFGEQTRQSPDASRRTTSQEDPVLSVPTFSQLDHACVTPSGERCHTTHCTRGRGPPGCNLGTCELRNSLVSTRWRVINLFSRGLRTPQRAEPEEQKGVCPNHGRAPLPSLLWRRPTGSGA